MITCTHCGLLGGPGEDQEWFCCVGCSLAHHLCGGELEQGHDRLLARVVLSAFLSMGVMVATLATYGEAFSGGDSVERGGEAARAFEGLYQGAAFLLTLPIVFLLGVPLVLATTRGSRWLTADGLVILGVGAALVTSIWNHLRGEGAVYFETASMVLVLVGLGRWLDVRAKERARGHITELTEEVTPPAQRLVGPRDEPVDPGELVLGDRVRVRPGDPLPVDGRVLEGSAFLDTARLTGESRPFPVSVGAEVLSGSRVLDGSLVVEATAVGQGRLREEVERLLHEALERPSAHVRLADRVSAVLLPLVLLLALGTLVVRWQHHGLEDALLAALAVALVSCPCSLGIATPLAFSQALGSAWRNGILVKGADVFERLAKVSRIQFDKTGTLTTQEVTLERIEPGVLGSEEALRLAAALEVGSEHPIARGLRSASPADLPKLEEFRVLPGRGVEGQVEGQRLRLVADESEGPFTVVALHSEKGEVLARFHLRTALDTQAGQAIQRLRLAGYDLSVLTGDGPGPAQALADELRIPVEHGLLPNQKVERVSEAEAAFVGEGLNDAAALAAAKIGIAVHGANPASLSAADVCLLHHGVGILPQVFQLARRAVSTARGNLAWAFAYNGIGWWLAITGRLTPIAAAGAMVASSVAVVLHSRRAASFEELPSPQQ